MRKRTVHPVNDVSLTLARDETLGLVGESGSGKTMMSLAIMGLLPQPFGRIVAGEIVFDGENLATRSDSELREIRGDRISMVFQEPMTSLDPLFTIGSQIVEAIRAHRSMSRRGGDRARGVDARAGSHPLGPPAVLELPARAVGRHAAAGNDRDGPLPGARAAPRRRADDGARRDGAGADPRPDRRAPGRAADGGAPDHPQPGRRPRGRRSRRRHVRRRDRRARADGGAVRAPATPVHARADQVDADGAPRVAPARDPGTAARPHGPPGGLPLRAAVPAGDRAVRPRASPRSRPRTRRAMRSAAGTRGSSSDDGRDRAARRDRAPHEGLPRQDRRRLRPRAEPPLGGGRRLADDRPRRDARPRGGVGLRQDDARAPRAAPHPAHERSDQDRGRGRPPRRPARAARAPAPRADRVPGPVLVPRPTDVRRRASSPRGSRASAARSASDGSASSSNASGSRLRSRAATRTSSPEASASGSGSPGRSPSIRSSSCSTSPCRRSTCPCSRRCSTSCTTCRRTSA